MELNYKQFGAGEPLIILHGLFGMLDNWQTIAKKLSQNNEVFVIDQRNHGKSPHSDEHSYLLMARDLLDFLEEQNLFSVHLLGHSMGGKTVMQFATLYPGFVKSVIVADIFPKGYKSITYDHQRVFETIQILKDCHFKDRKEVEKRIIEIIDNQRLSQFLFKNLKINQDGCISWKFNAKVLLNEYQNLMGDMEYYEKVKAPTLFLKAEFSNYIIVDEFESVKTYFPNSKLVVVPDTGHWLHADNPELFTEIVLDFLEKLKLRM